MSTGIGESKIFGGNYTREDGELPNNLKWETLHVAGTVMSDLPDSMQSKLFFQQTDEGADWWERNRHRLENRETATPQARGMRLADGSTATDEQEKIVAQFRDDLLTNVPERAQLERELGPNGLDKYLMIPKDGATADPLRAVAAKYLKPGQRALFMKEARINGEDGTTRGVLQYEIVKDAKGDPVRVRGMILGFVPEAAAKQAEQYYAGVSSDKLQNSQDQVAKAQQQIIDPQRLKEFARNARDEHGQRGGLADALGGIQNDVPSAMDFTVG